MNVFLPVFVIILAGFVLRKIGARDPAFWRGLATLANAVFFPALILGNLAVTDLGELPILSMAAALVTAVVFCAGLTLFSRRWLSLEGSAFAVIHHAALRPETSLGIAAAVTVSGNQGLTLATIAVLTLIPLTDLLHAPVLVHYGAGPDSGLKRVLWRAATNPLLLACVLGLAVKTSPIPLPRAALDTLYLLGHAAIPIGLLLVGASLCRFSLPKNLPAAAFAVIVKLLCMPALTYLACTLYKTPLQATLIATLFAALPSPAPDFQAPEAGEAAALAAALPVIQTILAALALPLALHLLG